MPEQSSGDAQVLVFDHDQALIGLLREEDGHEVVRYFASDAQADAARSDDDTRLALEAIGAFSDLDWDEMIDALHHIRHDSPPTPPIDL